MSTSTNDFLDFCRTQLSVKDLDLETNLLEIGLDSIQLIKFINSINASYPMPTPLTMVDLFNNPSVGQLFHVL